MIRYFSIRILWCRWAAVGRSIMGNRRCMLLVLLRLLSAKANVSSTLELEPEYYTTVLAKLVGESGAVDAYEIEPELARRARENLAVFPHVTLHTRSGAEGPLPVCDVLYVNAGATEPMAVWLDALRPNGRLLFPMTPAEGYGGMLLVTKDEEGGFAARFLMQVQFIPCVGARNERLRQRLTDIFRKGDWKKVRSLHRNNEPNESCWCSGSGWWLSTKAA